MSGLLLVALVVFLVCIGATRWLACRSLRFLSAEQKALVLESSLRSSVWHPLCLALYVGLVVCLPTSALPPYYWPGVFFCYALAPLLFSAALSAVSLLRISRLGLPQSYLRGARGAAIIYHVALLFLVCSIIYVSLTYARHRDQRRQTSNHAMQPTAGRRTSKFPVTQTSTPAAVRALASGG
jgi:hypothetical protein